MSSLVYSKNNIDKQMNSNENVKKNIRPLLIETQYLGSVHYYARLAYHQQVVIEQQEHFIKSTYRNRCYIATADGKLRLSVPLLKGRGLRKTIKDVKISYDHAWQNLHWHSLETAYRSSPYFEFYEDDFRPFYEQQFTYLLEFNQQLCQLVLDLLQVEVKVKYTTSFQKKVEEADFLDFRSAIHPNPLKANIDEKYTPPTYHQVFDTKRDFIKNLSILDLLFNEGPNSSTLLLQSIAKN